MISFQIDIRIVSMPIYQSWFNIFSYSISLKLQTNCEEVVPRRITREIYSIISLIISLYRVDIDWRSFDYQMMPLEEIINFSPAFRWQIGE